MSMKVRLWDNSTHIFIVTSEETLGVEYYVDLCEYPLGIDENGNEVFNGCCGLTPNRIHGCKNFIFDKEPELKKKCNAGKVFRCKHIRRAREYALDILLPILKKADPNQDPELQC